MQGAGQPAGADGNDSAGGKSAADQGAGRASETGRGQRGEKAGNREQAAGKTGHSSADKGKGSASRAGEKGGQPGDQGGQPGDGAPAKSSSNKNERQTGERTPGAGNRSDAVGGADDDRPRFQTKSETDAELEAEAANLDYARKATEMVLQHLKDEEHDPDPDLLDKLGWTREDLAEFLRRWDALQKSADETPGGKRELDEALRSLGLRDPANRKRAGGKTADDQRGLRDAGNRSAPPPRYRDLFDAFRKGAARSNP
jgi:hypothetical protein